MATLPLIVHQTIYQGATWRAAYRWLPGGVGQDFTGWTARMQARFGYLGAAALLDLTSDPDGGITLDAAGNIALHMSAEDTTALGVAIATTLRYDLILTAPAPGDVFRFLGGTLTVEPAVTREDVVVP